MHVFAQKVSNISLLLLNTEKYFLEITSLKTIDNLFMYTISVFEINIDLDILLWELNVLIVHFVSLHI